MDMNTKFDRAIDIRFKHGSDLIIDVTDRRSSQLRDAAVFAVDTLDLAWLGAQAVFEGKAKPEHAFQILDRIMETLLRMPTDDELTKKRRAEYLEENPGGWWTPEVPPVPQAPVVRPPLSVEELLKQKSPSVVEEILRRANERAADA